MKSASSIVAICIGAVALASPQGLVGEGEGPAKQFNGWDQNGDGQLVKNELPPALQKNFTRVDGNGDGFISIDEHLAVKRKSRNPSQIEGVRNLSDLSYAANENPRQKLDLYLPDSHSAEEKALPVVCWIHGGGWRNGEKTNGQRIAGLAASGKYAGVSIGYRLTGEAQWPAQIHDCKAAIRWIRSHAEEYGLDSERIAVWGSSAGGHLVAMLGVAGVEEGLEGDVGSDTELSSAVTCVVDFYGPTDLLRMNEQGSTMDHDATDSPESLLIGGAIQDHPGKAQGASPISYVSDRAATSIAPMLVVHGTEDPLVPYQQSVDFHEALVEAGVSSALVSVAGAGHGKGFGPKVQAIVLKYLAQQLLSEDGETVDQSLRAGE